MKRISIIVAALALSGCAVCKEHASACWIAAGVAATSIALSSDSGGGSTAAAPGKCYAIVPPGIVEERLCP